jgi:membrane protease YdiL (CAAX protease family)
MNTKKQRNQKTPFSERKGKHVMGTLLLSFTPILCSFLLMGIALFADFALINILQPRFSEAFSGADNSVDGIYSYMISSPFNQGLLSLLQYSLFLIIFGFWYSKVFCNSTHKGYRTFWEKPVAHMVKPGWILLYVVFGYSLQLLVDAVLTLFSLVFPEQFADYSELVDTMAGSGVSALMILSVILLAPIAEEIIFRGLTLRYARRIMPAWLAILFQAIGFGIYHGNLIQGLYAFCIGALFGVLACKTDSLIPSILLHAIINASAYLIPAFLLDSNIKAVLVLLIALVICVAIFLVLARRYNRAEHPEVEAHNKTEAAEADNK